MSTYTTSLGLELITPGSQAGLWGNTTNNTFTLIDQAITGVTPISFAAASGSTYTLTDFNGAANESRSAVINITGTASGANTIVVPNKQKTYLVRNNTGQDVVFRTASPSATYTVGAGYSILIFCDGNNNVFTGIASPGVGTLSVNAGGTGNTTFTAGFVKSTGGTNALTSASTVNMAAEVSGVLPVANGGTGQSSLTSGALLVGNGTGSMAVLTGGVSGYVPTWNGSTWVAAAPASAGVTSVFGRTGAVTAQSGDYSSFYPTLSGTGATGTWGISVSGNAATATSASTSANVTATGSNSITMTTNSAARVTVNSSGNVGIATTNPQRRLHVVGPSGQVASFPTVGVKDVLVLENNDTNCNINGITNGTGFGNFEIKGTVTGASGPYSSFTQAYNSNSPYFSWALNGSGKMFLNNAGTLLVGTDTNPVPSSTPRMALLADGGDALNIKQTVDGNNMMNLWQTGSATFSAMVFQKGSSPSTVGSITCSPSGTTYNTSSDYRLKESVQPMQGALAKIAKLNPVTFKWKVDGSDGQGFIAHELQAVIPDAVTGEKDAVYKDGAPKYQGVDASRIVATLVKAIQELKAEVDALKAAK